MICRICGKEGAQLRHVTDTIGKGDKLLVIENVPIISCRNCGESYYTAKTLHEMEEIRRCRRGTVRRQVEVAQFVEP
jgi:YgiT-type zinc finger domain-containing protein